MNLRLSAPLRIAGVALLVAMVVTTLPTRAQLLENPEIVAICGNYFEGPTGEAAADPCTGRARYAYYLDWGANPPSDLVVSETITVQVNWNGHPPQGAVVLFNGEIQTATGNTASKSYEMSTDFDPGGTLTVQARAADGAESEQVEAFFQVVDTPLTLNPDNWMQTGSNELKYEGKFQFTPDSLTASLGDYGSVSADIPGFGEGVLGVDIGLAPSMEIQGEGVALFALELGPNDNGNDSDSDAGRVSFKWGIKLAGGWRYVDNWAFDEASLELKAGVEVAAPPEPIPFAIPIGPLVIPAYYDGQITLFADLTLAIDGIADGGGMEMGDPMFNGILGFDPGYEAMLGVGYKKADLYFEGFIRVNVRVEIQYPNEPTLRLVRIVGAGGARAKVWIFGWELDPAVECWYSFVDETEDPPPDEFACNVPWLPSSSRATGGKSWSEPRPSTHAATGISSSEPRRLIPSSRRLRGPTASDPLLPRDYSASFVGTSDSSGRLEQPVVTDTFPQSQPSLVAVGEDLLLAWVDDDTNREPADRTEVVYSRWTKSSDRWSLPMAIHDDGFADFAVDMASFSSGAVAAWENASSNNNETDGVNLDSLATKLQIAVSIYDGSGWSSPPKIYGMADRADEMPKVAASDGTAMLTWLAARDAGFAASRDIYWAEYDGMNWDESGSVAVTVSNLTSHEIISYDMAYNSLGAWLVWVVDTDGDDTTMDDREIFGASYNAGTPPTWTVVQLTNDSPAVEDENPQLSVSVNGATATIVLVWYRGGDLVTKTGDGFADSAFSTTIAPDTVLDRPGASSRVADFTLIEDGAGPLTLVWQYPSEELVDLRYVFLDEENGTCSSAGTLCQSDSDCSISETCEQDLWSQERKLTTDENMEHSVTGVVLSDSFGPTGFALAYNDVGITRSSMTVTRDGSDYVVEDVPGEGQSDLMILRHVTKADVAVELGSMTLIRDPEMSATAPVTLQGRVVNVGDKPVSGLQVGFYDSHPGFGLARAVQLCTAPATGVLVGGESVVVEATNCQLPIQPQSIFMKVNPVTGETLTLDNVTDAPLAAADLVINEMWVTQWDECSQTIHLAVTNTGTSSTVDFSKIQLASGGGRYFGFVFVPPLGAGEEVNNLSFRWDVPDVGVNGIVEVIATVDSDNFVQELDDGNNSRSVWIDRNIAGAEDLNGDGVPDGCPLPRRPNAHSHAGPEGRLKDIQENQ